MAKTSSRRDKAPAQAVPQSREQVEEALLAIKRHQADLAATASALDTHIVELTERARRVAAPIEAEISRLQEEVHLFCAAHRAALTKNGKTKTVKFTNGVVTWRKSKVRVAFEVEEDDIIASIKAMKLRKFLRTVERVDKQAMLLHPAAARTIPGVRIVDGKETFAVESLE